MAANSDGNFRTFDNRPPAVALGIVRGEIYRFLAAVRRLLNPTSLSILRRGSILFRKDVFLSVTHMIPPFFFQEMMYSMFLQKKPQAQERTHYRLFDDDDL